MLLDATKGVDRSVEGPSIVLNNPRALYREGEYLVITAMNNNPYRGYLYLDYVDVAGDVVHVLPTPTDPENQVSDWGEVVVGAEDDQTCSLRQCYAISPPHGRSMVVAIWSRTPLLDGLRRKVEEPATDYFSWLGNVIQGAVDKGDNKLALSYQFLETRQ
jgi:hypothetical protein